MGSLGQEVGATAQHPSEGTVVLRCEEVTKAFGGVPVLRGVSLDVHAGEVLALAGENGAGKSTLLKIAAGQVRADEGEVHVGGQRLERADPVAARRLGVAIVPQELAPIPDLAVYENLFLGRERRGRAGLLARREMISQTRELLQQFGLDLDPRTPMRKLTVALQQIVEIVKSSSWGARVLLLDEPSSAISGREVGRLYDVIDRLRASGVAMVYTTHKMEEIRAKADRVVVLRDGRLAADSPARDISDDGIVTAMIGRELDELFPPVPAVPEQAEAVLEVRDVHVEAGEAAVSLQVRRGEVVALAGLVGAGRTELLEALFGTRRRDGEVLVAGERVRRGDPASAIRTGMALVPEDRKGSGLVLSMSVLDNGSLPHLAGHATGGWLRDRERTRSVAASMEAMRLRSRSLKQGVAELSGGNQQKVVLGRWLTGSVDVLLLDEPTRGVDVGARSEIYRNVLSLAERGMAVLMASSDMAEVLGLAHRVLVMRGGAISGELERDGLRGPDAQDRIFRLAAGVGDSTQVAA